MKDLDMFKIQNEERLKAAIYILLKQIHALDSKLDPQAMESHIRKELAGFEEFSFSDASADFYAESILRNALNPMKKRTI
jgi:hypothetical protein